MATDAKSRFEPRSELDIAWCPGCGDFGIRKALMAALEELDVPKEKLVMVSGIGQAAKMPQYLDASFFNGLHGRSLPAATAIKAVNPGLTVVVSGGDGDLYGEGGNHFLHATRRNPDITVLAHDNMVYGLTKGQAAPTSRRGMKTPVQVFGVTAEPLNPLALAIAMDVPFVARAFAGDLAGLKEIIKAAVRHKGLSLVDIFQPCVSFNKTNTFQWFKEHTAPVDPNHDPGDRAAAFSLALQEDPFPLGIIYRHERRASFEEELEIYKRSPRPLVGRDRARKALEELLASKMA